MSDIINIDCDNSNAFAEAMAIYLSSFPAEERHSIERIKERINSGCEELYCSVSNGETLGIALIWNLQHKDYGVLDYFAIKEDARCKGYGREFLRKLLDIYEEQNRTLIIEVEEYENNGDPIKIARASFYKSLGFKEIVDFRYVMPPIEEQAPVDMVLMLSRNYSEDKINQDELKKALASIYEEMYYVPQKAKFAASQLFKIDKPWYKLK